MTDSFGSSGADSSSEQEEGNNSFGTAQTGDTGTGTSNKVQVDPTEYAALRQRDEHAQTHITRLESENSELRDRVVALEDKIANATTLDEAIDRISKNGKGDQQIDQAGIAQIVEDVLGQHQTAKAQEDNWSTVYSKLTETYGDFKTADAKVQERAMELDIDLRDATAMARRNPKAFLQLFVPAGASAAARSSSAGESGQRGVSVNTGATTRDQAYYSKMRKENPNKYWNVDTQAQMRRDLFN